MADQWDRMFDYVVERGEKIVVAATISAGQSVIFKSPVLTGLFVNNWFAEINGITSHTTDVTGDGSFRLNELEQSLLRVELGDSISFCNALPYAVPLEYGHSAKGSAMVRLTALEWSQHITAAVNSL